MFRRDVLDGPARALALALAVTLGSSLAAQSIPHRVYVIVTDDAHKPVLGVGSEDFQIRDGGVRQHVLDSEPAAEPAAIAVVEAGLASDAAPLAGATAALERATVSANPLSAVSNLGGGLSLVEAVAGAADRLRASGTDRRAIVAIVGPAARDARDADPMADIVRRSKTPVWIIDVGPVGPAGRADAAIDAAVQAGGALRLRAVSDADVAHAADQIGTLIARAQYLITYVWPELSTGPIPLTTRHDRGIVLVPSWAR